MVNLYSINQSLVNLPLLIQTPRPAEQLPITVCLLFAYYDCHPALSNDLIERQCCLILGICCLAMDTFKT
jgi:hypothetical protein